MCMQVVEDTHNIQFLCVCYEVKLMNSCQMHQLQSKCGRHKDRRKINAQLHKASNASV